MKRSMLRASFPFVALVVALTPTWAVAVQDCPFQATTVISFQGYERQCQVWTGSGVGTVVGEFSTVFLMHDSGRFHKTSGDITITAANGDSLFLTIEQAWDWDRTAWVGTFSIVGGTGRFTYASGGGSAIAVFNSDAMGSDSTVTCTFDGTISF